MTIYIKPKSSKQIVPIQILSEHDAQIRLEITNILDEYLGRDFANFVGEFMDEILADCNYYKIIADDNE